jgi:predicted tellurium resistance membrane protein TerC
MFDWLLDPTLLASFVSLAALEIVLGIDNVVFLSVVTQKLPPEQARRARQLGLMLALLFRIMLLFMITWLIGLKAAVLPETLPWLSWKDLILIAGGLFLIVKAVQEMHAEIDEDEHKPTVAAAVTRSFAGVIGQVLLIDAIFSVDSIITAIGMVDDVRIMIAAVIVAIIVMYLAADVVSEFIQRNPTTKMLALAFLMLIGVALLADGFGHHIDRQYIYFAMGFAAFVEAFNIVAKRRRLKRKAEEAETGGGGPLLAVAAGKGMAAKKPSGPDMRAGAPAAAAKAAGKGASKSAAAKPPAGKGSATKSGGRPPAAGRGKGARKGK